MTRRKRINVRKHKRNLKSGQAIVVQRHTRNIKGKKKSRIIKPPVVDLIDKEYIEKQVELYGIDWLITQQRRVPIGVIRFGQFLAKDNVEWQIGLDFEDRIKGGLITNIIERVNSERWLPEAAPLNLDYEVILHTHPKRNIVLPSIQDIYTMRNGYGYIVLSKNDAVAYYINDKELFDSMDKNVLILNYKYAKEQIDISKIKSPKEYKLLFRKNLIEGLKIFGITIKVIEIDKKICFIPTKPDFIKEKSFKKAQKRKRKTKQRKKEFIEKKLKK